MDLTKSLYAPRDASSQIYLYRACEFLNAQPRLPQPIASYESCCQRDTNDSLSYSTSVSSTTGIYEIPMTQLGKHTPQYEVNLGASGCILVEKSKERGT